VAGDAVATRRGFGSRRPLLKREKWRTRRYIHHVDVAHPSVKNPAGFNFALSSPVKYDMISSREDQMSANAPQLVPEPVPQSVPDNMERVLTFLRQESAAHREALREDSKANRDMLIGATRIIAIPVAAAIVLVGWLGWKSFSDLKEQLVSSATEQIKTETVRMQGEIRNRLAHEFQTATIQQTVKDSAREATQTAAAPLIKSEVTREVQAHIQAERPQIHATVIAETKKGVSAIQPQIDAEVKQQADAAEARIKTQISPYGETIKASTLAALARNGLGTAFDDLMNMSRSSNPDIQNLAVSTRNAIFMEYEQARSFIYMQRAFTPKKTKEEMMALLSDPQPLTRRAAIDGLSELNEKSFVPQAIQLMEHDPYIMVRESAFHALVQLTGQKFNPLDQPGWNEWWEKNKDNWPPK
jgi:hypothetical protein